MATRAVKLQVPPTPFDFTPRYFLDRRFSLAGLGCSFNYTPRLAIDPAIYIDRGCSTVNINAGYHDGPTAHQGEYAALNRANRSVFLAPSYIQDSLGGKHFSDLILTDCRTAVDYAWNRANGYGVITSGAQEGRFDNDYWAQLTSYSLSAYKGISQAWGEKMIANPGLMYAGCYDGIIYLDMGDSASNFRNALSSNANALAYMLAHTYGPNPYFREGLYNYHPPLVNLYFRASTDLCTKYAEVRLAIKLTQMALAEVGKYWPVCVFVFPGDTEFVSYPGNGYSEKMVRDTPGGGTMEEYGFPGYSHAFQWDLAFTALDQTRFYYGWQDTLIWGQNPAWVPPDILRDGDSFPLRKHYGGSVTVKAVGPTPYVAGVDYPFPPNYEGHSDLAPLGAEFYADMARFGGQNSQVARHRVAGTSTWCSLDYGYLVDRWKNREAVVDVARIGNQGWCKVSPYGLPLTGPFDMEVDVGSGQSILCEVDPSSINAFKFNL